MSDAATEGSVTEATPPAGTPETQPAAETNGSVAAVENPFAGLQDEGTRKWVETKGYKSHEDLAKAAMNAEQKLGSSLTMPKDDAPKEEWDKFYSRLGRPESADKYEFRRPEGLPENLPWDDAGEKALKQWAFDAGVPTKQAQTILDGYAKMQADRLAEAQAAQMKAASDTTEALVKDWGPADSEGFQTKKALMDRAAQKLGLVDAFKESGVILPDGSLLNPQIAKALAAVGESMFKEDAIEGSSAIGGANPFTRDANGQRNVTGISQLVKSDPQRAARLAREAGENPRSWGIRL